MMARKSLPWLPPATAAIPSAADVGDRKSAFMKIASAVPLIPVVKLEGDDRLVVTQGRPNVSLSRVASTLAIGLNLHSVIVEPRSGLGG